MSASPIGTPPPSLPSSPLPPALAIAGPTASGKTAAALAIAQAFAAQAFAGARPVEIISVDSALVYRGMDVGTAKPSAAEQGIAPHHLIDIRDPLEAYSAAEFVRDATRLIHDIHARGHLPLLVGGTMLYFKALLEGLDDLPPADPDTRAALDAEAKEHGWPAMHAELMRVDPVTAARLAPGDSQRIQRALEVFRLTGQPLSDFHTRRDSAQANTTQQAVTLISLEPDDRAWLHARIAQRFDAMLQGGLLDEVRALRARGDLHVDLPSMRCVGYRQVWEALEGRYPMHELRERGIAATRQLAKRQITWLRSMAQSGTVHHVVACDAPDAQARVLDMARQFIAEKIAA